MPMTKFGFPPALITALRLMLGAFFIMSGLEKLLDLKFFGLIIAEYQILPSFLIPSIALLVSLCELLCFKLLSQWYSLKEEIGIVPIIRDILLFILLLKIRDVVE